LLFAAARHGFKTVMITSPDAGEGKSAITANLGLTLARMGKRITLVSADLRRPRLHSFFRCSNFAGLVSVLQGHRSLAETLLHPPGIRENLRLLPSGPPHKHSAELLGSEAMKEVLDELAKTSDLVVIDATPLLPVADALALARLVDAIVVVADSQTTTTGAVQRARQRLDQVEGPVIGCVLNRYDAPYGGYHYQRLSANGHEPVIEPDMVAWPTELRS
jgi:capsular exopolysaccharide synthesis family protein